METYGHDNSEGKRAERPPTFDLSVAIKECEAANLKLMELHRKNPFARVVEEGSSAPDPEPPPPGMLILATPEPGGEEDRAGRELLAEKEKMFAALHQKFDAELQEIGLALVESAKLYWYGNMKISLSDPYRFLSYLEKLSESVATPSQVSGVKELLTRFYNTVKYGHRGAGGLDEDRVDTLDDEQNNIVVDFLAVREKLNSVCQKLDSDGSKGLIGALENFTPVVEAAKQRCLREYLIAERYNLLAAPGGQFSLSDVHAGILDDHLLYGSDEGVGEDEHIRSALSNYQRIWDDVLRYVRVIKKNEHARQLYKDVIKNLQSVLSHAEDDILGRGYEFSKEERKSSLLSTIRGTKEALEALEGENR